MFAIAWQYLMGRSVAASWSDRDTPEWPPHPDRLFQSLVAAWASHNKAPVQEQALRWLEGLGAPEIVAPLDAPTPKPAQVFVPLNDVMWPKKRGKDGDLPGLLPRDRTRKGRTFPTAWVGDEVCALCWPDADAGQHRPALEQLTREVTYLGHSSSLVRMWVEDEPPSSSLQPVHTPDSDSQFLRVFEPGRLDMLIQAFGDGGARWKRPEAGRWVPYAAKKQAATVGALAGPMIIFRKQEGVAPGLHRSLSLMQAIRHRVLPYAEGEALALLSGHSADGRVSERPHVAYLPLAFVGAPHADGHLLGVALALPTDISSEAEEGIRLALACACHPDRGTLDFVWEDGRSTSFVVDDRASPPWSMQARTWRGPAREWSSVTPVVLDRQAPRRHADPDAFVSREIELACQRVGLPAPAEVYFGNEPWLEGVPHARAFAPMPSKGGLQRRHVHVRLRFEDPVVGPIALGAGRYRGYGLCQPRRDGR
ncbi:MAG: type I-U CRISPR-associated protein Cas5/Cas6 [Myxococcales bacterium]|nr:type I-U CRISPR-associated protein Cas5/Cas6 [Myxococcales bacterium]